MAELAGRILTIAQKEFKELLSNRSSVILGTVVSIFFALSYGLVMVSGGNGAQLDSTIFLISAMLGVFSSYTFDAQVFLREKMDKVIETLLCAPVSLQQIWMGKVLGVSILSHLISLLAILVLITTASLRLGSVLLPSPSIVVYMVLVVPVFIAAFSGLYGLAQMALGLRENRFLGLIIFIPLFAGISIIPSLLSNGLVISWLAVGLVLAGSIFLIVIAGFLSRLVSKERIVTTLA